LLFASIYIPDRSLVTFDELASSLPLTKWSYIERIMTGDVSDAQSLYSSQWKDGRWHLSHPGITRALDHERRAMVLTVQFSVSTMWQVHEIQCMNGQILIVSLKPIQDHGTY